MTIQLAPIAIFAFNRPDHLAQTLGALSKCHLIESSDVVIFIDGARTLNDDTRSVESVAKNFKSSKSLEVIIRESNLGLAKSIINGVTSIIDEHSKIIVLEDDMIVSSSFLEYMNYALDKYINAGQVASIHGYVYPTKESLPEAFFIKGADCWGWATWADRWKSFETDGSILLKKMKDRGLSWSFDLDGTTGFSKMLLRQTNGENDSWAIRWHAFNFLENKLTLYPGKSLVQNIGIDDSGTHCIADNSYDVELSTSLPNLNRVEIQESKQAREHFKKFFMSQKMLPSRILYYVRFFFRYMSVK